MLINTILTYDILNARIPKCLKKADFRPAGVAELADALDLGSSAQKAWEFKSLRPHQ